MEAEQATSQEGSPRGQGDGGVAWRRRRRVALGRGHTRAVVLSSGHALCRVGFPPASPGISKLRCTVLPTHSQRGDALPLGDMNSGEDSGSGMSPGAEAGQRIQGARVALLQGQSEPAAHRPGECHLRLRRALPEEVGKEAWTRHL